MAIYQAEKIAEDVRVALAENKRDDVLLEEEDTDTLLQKDLIISKIEEAVRRVESVAPVLCLEGGKHFGVDDAEDELCEDTGSGVFWNDDLSGWLLLPDDFMRLVSFRMSDWERTVRVAITADDPRYDMQSSRHKGIRGNVQKPVCAIVDRPEGKALEFWSCNSKDAYVERATYRAWPRMDSYGGIDISERCYTAVVYTIASLVLTAYGESEKASALNALAQSSFE